MSQIDRPDVILVEDDKLSRENVAGELENLGHEVRQFADGASAWKAFDENPSRIVISDWKMPKMDGLELCRKIRNRLQTPYTYFLLITASKPGEIGYDLSIGGEVDDFLVKPVRHGQLWRRMRVATRILQFTTEMRKLEQLLPICSYCHKMREGEEGPWESLEQYLSERTGSTFSHGICPDCLQRWMEGQASIRFGKAD